MPHLEFFMPLGSGILMVFLIFRPGFLTSASSIFTNTAFYCASVKSRITLKVNSNPAKNTISLIYHIIDTIPSLLADTPPSETSLDCVVKRRIYAARMI
jgi:hypothetical protein